MSTKICIFTSMVFRVVMYRCESWTIKKLMNLCFWIVLSEKTLERPLDGKKSQPVNPKGNQPWIFTGRMDAETEVPLLWPPDAKSQLTGKDLDAEKDWGQEEKEVTEDEMVGRHHWLSGHEFEQAVEDSEGQITITWYRHYYEHPKWGNCSIDRLRSLSPNK